MDFLLSIPLNNTSLLFVVFYPFVYFGYHQAYWYRPPLLKRLDFFFIVVAILLACAVGFIAVQSPLAGKWQFSQMALLHLAPLCLSVLVATHGRQIARQSVKAVMQSGRGRGGDAPGSGGSDYNPMPINQEVEKIGWDELVIDDDLRQELVSIIHLLKDPKTAVNYGIRVPKGILLYGPPGTGKTTIAKVIAKTAGLAFFALQTDEIVSKWVGESEKNLTKLFQAASRYKPAVVFIDEIDSIGKSRSEGNAAWADNLLNHLLQMIDGVIQQEGLYIIGATNRVELVDAALKRSGRLENTIEIPLPNYEARKQLFVIGFSSLNVKPGIDIDALAKITEGKSGADIKAICNQAGLNSFKRETGSGKRDFQVTVEDIKLALQHFVL